jgi:hypothetical protein
MKADAQLPADREKEALQWVVDYFREQRNELRPDSSVHRVRHESNVETLVYLHDKWRRDEPEWLDSNMADLVTLSEKEDWAFEFLGEVIAKLIERGEPLSRPLRDFTAKFL